MSFKVKDEDKGFEAFFRGLRGLTKRVKVGIQGAEAGEMASWQSAGRGGGFMGGLTVVELGAIHEFGAVVKDGFGKGIRIVIPERSFLRSTADMNRNKYEKRMKRMSRKLLTKPLKFNAHGELMLLGESVRRDIINRMRRGEITPPLAQSTINRRKRGRGGKKDNVPLVDTGLLMGSISSVVE